MAESEHLVQNSCEETTVAKKSTSLQGQDGSTLKTASGASEEVGLRMALAREKNKAGASWSVRPSPLELHCRCRDTIEKCSARLRERQRKMDRLQLLLPLPNSTQCLDRSAATPISTPPRPVKRNKRNVASVSKRGASSPGSSPAWISPATSILRAKQQVGGKLSSRLRYDTVAASPLFHKNVIKRTPFRNSSTATVLDEKQETTPSPITESSQASTTDKSTGPSLDRSAMLSPTWSQRQQEFMAAIEAEACSDESPDTSM